MFEFRKMKRAVALILCACCLISFAACTPEEKPAEPLKDNSGMTYDRYDLETYLYPLWEGNTVYNETIWFAGDNFAPLLYVPDEILSVKSYDLETTYEEGTDYLVDEDSIALAYKSGIPSLSMSQLYGDVPINPQIAVTVLPELPNGGKYLYVDEGATISRQQVAVTYTHSNTIEWVLPRVETEKFPKTMEKLENGESIKVLFYGDSITVGANSSEYISIKPYAESYANMVKSYMAARYPEAEIVFKNNAVGGTDSNWGIDRLTGLAAIDDIVPDEKGEHFSRRVLNAFDGNETADLLFIAYGMNDQAYGSGQFKDNIEEMIVKVREKNPEIEIMLVSGMIANPETGFYNKDYEAYQEALAELTEEYENVGLSTTLNTVLSVYEHKRFYDCTANNVNHPNDFMMRIYAQTLLYSLFGADYIDYI
jgi:hypothetical protein